jgi:hypothetical protein
MDLEGYDGYDNERLLCCLVRCYLRKYSQMCKFRIIAGNISYTAGFLSLKIKFCYIRSIGDKIKSSQVEQV